MKLVSTFNTQQQQLEKYISTSTDWYSDKKYRHFYPSTAGSKRAKVLIIGTGEFGTALAQSTRLATISSAAGGSFSSNVNKTASNVDVVSVSARAFLLNQKMDDDEMAALIANSRYIMYCGSRLTQHSQGIAEAMIKAKTLSTKEPLVDFIDWSNPDPGVDANDDLQGAVMLARFLRDADNDSGTEAQTWKVWKATGVSNLDIAGHMVRFGRLRSSLLRQIVPFIFCTSKSHFPYNIS